jgi:hemolysin D
MEIGAVRAIHVRKGQHVSKGQLLIELDPTIAGAEEAQANRGLLSARIGEAQNSALLPHLAGRPAVFRTPDGTPPTVAETQNEFVRSSVAGYEAQRASLKQGRAERIAELGATSAEIAKLRQTLPLVEEQLEARRALTLKGDFPKLKLLEYEQLRVEHLRDIDVQENNAGKSRAAIANVDAQLRQLREEFAKKAATDLSAAEDESGVRSEEVRKSERRRVETISRDAVQQQEEGQPSKEGQAHGAGLVYTARIRLERNWIEVGDRRQPIGPGLSVQAEIKTGERRIIRYLLSPIWQALRGRP